MEEQGGLAVCKRGHDRPHSLVEARLRASPTQSRSARNRVRVGRPHRHPRAGIRVRVRASPISRQRGPGLGNGDPESSGYPLRRAMARDRSFSLAGICGVTPWRQKDSDLSTMVEAVECSLPHVPRGAFEVQPRCIEPGSCNQLRDLLGVHIDLRLADLEDR